MIRKYVYEIEENPLQLIVRRYASFGFGIFAILSCETIKVQYFTGCMKP